MSDYWDGVIVGAGAASTILLIVGTIMSKLDHESWKQICDSYSDLLDRERERRKAERSQCWRHPVPGKPCQPPSPHEVDRGGTGCIWCGKPITKPRSQP